jgi:hypothetical protein
MNESNTSEIDIFNGILDQIEKLFEKEVRLVRIQNQLKLLKEEWAEAEKTHTKPQNTDERYEQVLRGAQEKIDWILWSNLGKKEEICGKLEEISKSEDKQTLVDHYKDLRSEWRSLGPIPREKRKDVETRFSEICKTIAEKCKLFSKELDLEKDENLHIKESLCKKIEGLTQPRNWKKATEFVQKIQKNWNSLGPVPKVHSDALWERFHKACNDFFETKRNFFKSLKEKYDSIIRQKEEICQIASEWKDSRDWKNASQKIKELQAKWNSLDRAPSKIEKKLLRRFKPACDHFFHAQKEHFTRLEKELPENLEKKKALCEEMENLGGLSDQEKIRRIKDAQARWKEIGPVPKGEKDSIWQRFRKPIDDFFKNREEKYLNEKKQREESGAVKEKLCEEAEALASSRDWKETSIKLKEMQEKWKSSGHASSEQERALWNRFHSACDLFFNRMKEDREISKKGQNENSRKKLEICILAEMISEIPLTEKQAEEKAKWQLEKLSENFFFKVFDEDLNTRDQKARKMIELQKEWKEIGSIPHDKSQELWERFNKACNYFFQNSKRSHE